MEVYCNFAFKRNIKDHYIICCAAFYADRKMTKQIGRIVRAYEMWEDQQYVCAVQSYEYALNCIYEEQAKMSKAGVHKVWLISSNSALVGWIAEENRNVKYRELVNKAKAKYLAGGKKEIHMPVGVLTAVNYDPAYKYCNVANIQNEIPFTKKVDTVNKIDVIGSSVLDIIGVSAEDSKKDNDGFFQ